MATLLKVFAAMLFVCASLHAEAIDEYNTTITVNSDGSLHIREKIRYDFGDLQRHGIYREIPLTVKLEPLTPEVAIGLSLRRITMDGAPVPWEKEISFSPKTGRMVRYRIGDPERTVGGVHLYTLEYTVRHGVFPSDLPGMEAIRWNAVGADSSVATRHANAEILLPPELESLPLKIRAYTGTYGYRGNRARIERPDRGRIRFHVDRLGAYEALTVEVNYPAGALGQSADRLRGTIVDYLLHYWYLWAGLLYLLWLFRYAQKLGIARLRPGSLAPRYRPPEGMSVLQAGVLLDRFADAEDLTAAILELGALGCLEIDLSEDPDAPVIRRRVPGCDREKLTVDQRYLLEGVLFPDSDSYTVRTDDPQRAKEIDEQMERVGDFLYSWSLHAGLMRDDLITLRNNLFLRAGGVGAGLSALALWHAVRLYGAELVFALVFLIALLVFAVNRLRIGLRTRSFAWILFGGVCLLFFSVILYQLLVDDQYGIHLLLSPLLLPPILGGALWWVYRHIGKRTSEGLKRYRELLGYRLFLRQVERDRLRRMLEEDPALLDRGLAYAVLFGLQSRWFDLYGELDVSQPSWIRGKIDYLVRFSRAMERQRFDTSSSSLTRIGGYSGGGSYSGGGGGGGSVGSW